MKKGMKPMPKGKHMMNGMPMKDADMKKMMGGKMPMKTGVKPVYPKKKK